MFFDVDVAVLPTYKLPPIPTPPATVSAPVIVDVAIVVLVIVNIPPNVLVTPATSPTRNLPKIVPPTYKLPPIPTPPATTSAPVVELTAPVATLIFTKDFSIYIEFVSPGVTPVVLKINFPPGVLLAITASLVLL